MKKWTVDIEGKACQGWVQKIQGELWVHLEGRTYSYKPQSEYGTDSSQSNEDTSQIKAPMPGKIIKINYTPEESVQGGDVALVMEAMKMEYTLKVPADSKVDSILCQEGEQVSLGQVLMTFEVDNA